MKTPRIILILGLAVVAAAPVFGTALTGTSLSVTGAGASTLSGTLTVTGASTFNNNLTITGWADVMNNQFTLGASSTVFSNWVFADSSVDTLANVLNRGSASWLWAHGTTGSPVPAMRLDSSHNLLLFNAAGTTAGITLTPASNQISLGTATLSGSGANLTVGGALTVTSGITNTTGALTSPTALSLTAGGTNQNITLTPSGTGYTILNGKVGIGTATPGYQLEVHGVGSSNIGLTSTGHTFMQATPAAGFNTYYDNLLVGSSTIFRTSNAASADLNALCLLANGSVGIGTSSPATTLDVQGAAASFRLYGTGTNDVPQIQLRNVGQIWQWKLDGADSNKLKLNDGGGTNRFTMDTAGNVGIGTASPATALQVGTSFQAENGSAVWVNNQLNGGTKAAPADLYINYGSQSYDTYLQGTKVVVKSNGNVGIGTASPNAKLDVNSSATGGFGLNVVGGQLGGSTAVVTTNYPSVTANGTNYTRNLGFYSWYLPIAAGVTDNGYRIGLDIENYTIDPNFLGTLSSQYGLWARVGSNSAGTGTIQNSYAVYIENLDGPATIVNKYGLYQSNTTARNYFAGNVGIGTTNPTQKLSVAGTIRAYEVIVDTGWADYVFDPNYRLAPLSEVEQHIKTEKHLPGIPSAQEIAEHGVSMGDMQSKLLSKIEEITLHQIAQEKQLNAQAARIAQLEQENRQLRTASTTP